MQRSISRRSATRRPSGQPEQVTASSTAYSSCGEKRMASASGGGCDRDFITGGGTGRKLREERAVSGRGAAAQDRTSCHRQIDRVKQLSGGSAGIAAYPCAGNDRRKGRGDIQGDYLAGVSNRRKTRGNYRCRSAYHAEKHSLYAARKSRRRHRPSVPSCCG